jgi:hypothetical protein
MSSEIAVLDSMYSREVQVLSLPQILSQVELVQKVKEAVMKEWVHYGTIPGTPKPMLYQAGAHKLLMTFRLAAETSIEDLSRDADEVRYRVKATVTHAPTGTFLASGYGFASSNEEKYKWRAAVCKQEWDEYPDNMRRKKWKKGKGGTAYSVIQVRTESADIENTVLKMAVKRAVVAAAIQATAASDIFGQDLEDLSEELREHLAESESESGEASEPIKEPQRKSENGTKAEPKPAGKVERATVTIKKAETRKKTDGAPYVMVVTDKGQYFDMKGKEENWKPLVGKVVEIVFSLDHSIQGVSAEEPKPEKPAEKTEKPGNGKLASKEKVDELYTLAAKVGWQESELASLLTGLAFGFPDARSIPESQYDRIKKWVETGIDPDNE